MNQTRMVLALVAMTVLTAVSTADEPAKRSPREALHSFNDLIGSWRGTGEPEGTRAEKQKGFWQESIAWSWQFKGDDAWLTTTFEKGKYFASGQLRYLADKDSFQLTLTTVDKEKQTFTGKLDDGRLILSREDEAKKETQHLIFTFLHSNRYLYRYEVRPEGKTGFTKVYQVGATKEGEEFAAGDGQPECIVSGGLGKFRVTYKDQTYYVCCGGCRTEFNADPEKYIKEFEEKKKKKKP
jgi:YHS domain-containing protein